MIKLYNATTNKYHHFETTKFPDKTSQVWKINPEPDSTHDFRVLWQFEEEAEFIHVMQLGYLLHNLVDGLPELVVPYLPYARQDKEPTNSTTFALWPIIGTLRGLYKNIKTYDAHSDILNFLDNTSPKEFFLSTLDYDGTCVVVFPDSGAMKRYHDIFPKEIPVITGSKIRNQQTGEITGLELDGDIEDINGKCCIIYDDLADGGMTFIKMAEKLKEYNPLMIDLVVSHGIFSKGLDPLYQAGISNIYTTNTVYFKPMLESPDGTIWNKVRNKNFDVVTELIEGE